ncbi:hypothetical protein FGO68_gene16274 [Halteria grandinella]|uniref:Uncharacterized protein n=1 Tax=Halteria grandinella TaxID=5974 RepID=A0A8J8NG74_HALGN|nr:hypothetical protein FGO68_gene16274 [Halteria grandinella]
MNQDKELPAIEEEQVNVSADQHLSDESSQESEGLFQSQKQIKRAHVLRDRTLFCERLVKAFSTYVKFLSGNQLSDDEQRDLKMSLGTCTPSRLNQLNDEYQYITEFDYHMGDLVLVQVSIKQQISQSRCRRKRRIRNDDTIRSNSIMFDMLQFKQKCYRNRGNGQFDFNQSNRISSIHLKY